MHRYLVVANQTLGGQELLDAIRDRMTRDAAQFWVLVPATPTRLVADFGALSLAFPISTAVQPTAAEAHDQGITAAQANLTAQLDRLREIGAVVDGAVGDADPLAAIEKAVSEHEFDEIILSTLPAGVSRWLALDLPHRVQRKSQLPLTVITAAE